MNDQVEVMRRTREQASFDPRCLNQILHEWFMSPVGFSPLVADANFFPNHDEAQVHPKSKEAAEGSSELGTAASTSVKEHDDRSGDVVNLGKHRIYRPTDMFRAIIEAQGTSDQQTHWLKSWASNQVSGLFASSELGHGAFLRGVETSAHYNPQDDQFILNTGSASGAKLWLDILPPATTTTHIIVPARLMIGSKDYGVAFFIAPFPCAESGSRMADGIEIFTVPTKGTAANATRLICFSLHNVQIPRENMLMGSIHVSKSGTCTRTRPSLTTDLVSNVNREMQSSIVFIAAISLAKALAIATRLTTVQSLGYGHYSESTSELLNIARPAVHRQLLTLTSQVFGILFANYQSRKLLQSTKSKQQQQQSCTAILRPGLKAWAIGTAASGILDLHKICGPLSFAPVSKLQGLLNDAVILCAQGGDTFSSYENTATSLIELVQVIKQEGCTMDISKHLAYLRDAYYTERRSSASSSFSGASSSSLSAELSITGNSEDSLSSPLRLTTLLTLHQHHAATLLFSTASRLQESATKERFCLGRRKAWDDHHTELMAATKAVLETFVLESFIESIELIKSRNASAVQGQEQTSNDEDKDGVMKVVVVLEKLCMVFGLSTLGKFDDMLKDLYGRLLPDILALTESWGFENEEFSWGLGKWDNDRKSSGDGDNDYARIIEAIRKAGEDGKTLKAKL